MKGLKGQARVITKLDRCGGKRVEHAGQGAINKQSGCVPEMDRFNKEANIRVKGELVGKSIPPDGNQTSLEKETRPDGSGRNPAESGVHQKHGHISKYAIMHILRAYLKISWNLYMYIYN